MDNLTTILNRHQISEQDRPAFLALVELGTSPDAAFKAKLRRGRYKMALDEALDALTATLDDRFPPVCLATCLASGDFTHDFQ